MGYPHLWATLWIVTTGDYDTPGYVPATTDGMGLRPIWRMCLLVVRLVGNVPGKPELTKIIFYHRLSVVGILKPHGLAKSLAHCVLRMFDQRLKGVTALWRLMLNNY